MKIGGGGGDKDSGRGPMYLGEEGYLKASFSLLRPRILSLGNTSFQQRTGMISHPGDNGLSQLAGLHMGFSSSRCSVGTHLLSPNTSCQCPAGSCFLGESPGMFPETGPVIDFFWNPQGWPCLGNQTIRYLIQPQSSLWVRGGVHRLPSP